MKYNTSRFFHRVCFVTTVLFSSELPIRLTHKWPGRFGVTVHIGCPTSTETYPYIGKLQLLWETQTISAATLVSHTAFSPIWNYIFQMVSQQQQSGSIRRLTIPHLEELYNDYYRVGYHSRPLFTSAQLTNNYLYQRRIQEILNNDLPELLQTLGIQLCV